MESSKVDDIVIYSGGLDSSVLLWQLKEKWKQNIQAVSFDYGQRHKKELECAKEVTSMLNIEHIIVDLSSVGQLLQGSALTTFDIDVPEGHYADESMKQTIVANRNAIMLSIACGVAVAKKIPFVYYAAHKNDYAIYSDCRPEFVKAFDTAMYIGNDKQVEVIAPFVHLTKAEIVKIGLALSVPFEKTWSCYKGEDLPCGKCGTCTERLEAFSINNAIDPLLYQGSSNIMDTSEYTEGGELK